MKTLSKAAQEKIALRQNSDARKFARKGASGHVYAAEALRRARTIARELPTDWNWTHCQGVR